MTRHSKIAAAAAAQATGANLPHPMIGVQESSGPITKEEPKPLDVTEGKRFGADIIARVHADSVGWAPVGLRLASGTAEFRAGVVAALTAEREALKRGAILAHAFDEAKVKAANSANTRLSEVSTICAAFSAAGTVADAVAYHHAKAKRAEDLSFRDWYEYAKYVKGADARGRPADTLMVAFAKWIKREAEKDQERTPEERNMLAALREVAGKYPAPVKAEK